MLRAISILLVVVFVVLLFLNVVLGAPAVVLGNPELDIPGEYFFWSHGTVYEITFTRYILSFVVFFAEMAIFLFLIISSLILQAKGHKPRMEEPSRLSAKALPAVLITSVLALFVYGFYRGFCPNPLESVGMFVNQVSAANRFYRKDKGLYAVTAKELVDEGHLHHSSVAVLNGEAALNGYTFSYKSDGESYECIGQPTRTDSDAYVFFITSESSYLFRIFQNTSIELIRNAISNQKR